MIRVKDIFDKRRNVTLKTNSLTIFCVVTVIILFATVDHLPLVTCTMILKM